MSTKLFDGTRYDATIGAERYVRMLAAAVEPVHERLAAEAAGRLLHAAVWANLTGKPIHVDDAIDQDLTNQLALTSDSDEVGVFTSFLPAVERILEAGAASRRRINPTLSLELSVHFMSDPAGGPYGYAYPYATNRELRSVWSTLPGVEEYACQNSTDEQLATLGESEWHERRDTWDRVIGRRGVIADVSVAYRRPLPSVFLLYLNRRRWFLAAAARGFGAAETERIRTRAQARTDHYRQQLAQMVTRWGNPTTAQDVAAQQERDDAELAARFQ